MTFDTAVGSKDSKIAPAPGTAGKRGNLNSRQIIRNLSEFGARKKTVHYRYQVELLLDIHKNGKVTKPRGKYDCCSERGKIFESVCRINMRIHSIQKARMAFNVLKAIPKAQ